MSTEVEFRKSTMTQNYNIDDSDPVNLTPTNSPPSDSPHARSSTSSWDETLETLSCKLKTICCGQSPSTVPVAGSTPTVALRPQSRGLNNSQLGVMWNLDGPTRKQHNSGDNNLSTVSSTPAAIRGSSSLFSQLYMTPSGTSNHNRHSLVGNNSNQLVRSGWRPLRVLHEETADKLRQSLTKICHSPTSSTSSLPQSDASAPTSTGTDQSTGGDSLDASSTAAKSHQLRIRESLKSGVRFRVNLDELPCEPDNLFVVVRRSSPAPNATNGNTPPTSVANSAISRSLCICSALDPLVPLRTVSLPELTRVCALACCIIDGRTLYIRERSKDLMYLEFEHEPLAGRGDGPVVGQVASSGVSKDQDCDMYLPVIREDESQLTVNISLHVADSINFEDLSVKTIDLRLVIRAQHNSTIDRSACHSIIAGGFTLMMELPEGTYNRTVRAAFAVKEHQLMITAQRSAASRRMTCTF